MPGMSRRDRHLPTLLALALIAAACTAGGIGPSSSIDGVSPTPVASRSEQTSSTPSGAPTASAPEPTIEWADPVLEAPTGMLPPGSVAVVTVDGLRIRGGHPGMGELFDQIALILDAGNVVTVGWSPFSYLPPNRSPDGRGWYEVRAGGRGVGGGEFYGGWVAAGEAGLEFLRIAPVACPSPVSLEVLLWTPPRGEEGEGMTTPWDRPACVGNRSIRLEGVFETCYEGGHYPYVFEPGYLAVPDNCASLMLDDIDASGHVRRAGWLPLGIPPALAGEAPKRGDLIRITGHFDDSALSTCTATPSGPFPNAVDPAFLALFCRERFVVEGIEVIGHRELAPLP